MSLLKYVIYLVVIVCIILLITGHFSLMKKDTHHGVIPTPHVLDSHNPSITSDDPVKIQEQLTNFAQQLTNDDQQQVRNIKEQIIHQFKFKPKTPTTTPTNSPASTSTSTSMSTSVSSDLTSKELSDQNFRSQTSLGASSLVVNDLPKAPELENFEDYAPVIDRVPVPLNKNLIQLASQDNRSQPQNPTAPNEYDNLSTSRFESEYRTIWSERKGKDDLNDFFEVLNPQATFNDTLSRKPVVDPHEWEQQTKKPFF